MRVINRTAVAITGAQPYIDWTRHTDGTANTEAVTVKTFREWFRIDIHSVVVDVADDDEIEGEEL